MKRLYIISNRLPLEVTTIDGEKTLQPVAGGFHMGIRGFHNTYDIKWLGRGGVNIDDISETEKMKLDNLFRKNNCIPIYLEKQLRDNFLEGFCDHTLWPLFNYFTQFASYDSHQWEAYRQVNQTYADTIARYATNDDIIWIHDYHLMLVPGMLREKNITMPVGYFQHIPFPSFEVFRLLPWRMELLRGILEADLIGFHIYDYQRHFMSSVRRLLGHETIFNRIRLNERIVKVDAFPLGIDYSYFNTEAKKLAGNSAPSEVQKALQKYFNRSPDRKLILSIDRLDYTKGLPERLKTFELFLMRYPAFKEKVSLFLYVEPSRENVTEYRKLKSRMDELVGRINGKFGTINWMPVWYFYKSVTREERITLYSHADIALITPTRDGMNLNAKEYIASRINQDGVLILSEMAGAAKELGESLIVNPNNRSEVAETIFRALNLSKKEQQDRMLELQKRLEIYNDERWARDYISGLLDVGNLQKTYFTEKLSDDLLQNLKKQYQQAKRRIIFLDYDGTLTGFHNDPQMAMPDKELYRIVGSLLSPKENTVVVISGRDKETLSKWFEGYDRLAFIAEHGVWHKDPGGNWRMSDQIEKDWMDVIEPLLQNFVDRTPRSFIEYKNYSLVWHYRHADPDMGQQRAWELKEDLKNYIANLNLEIMDGDKVIEIKNAGINKGRAALHKMGGTTFDFILAVGDDWTDEFTFKALPDHAHTIKVGTKSTAAKYYINSVSDVRQLLSQLEDLK
jgi:trehalose 6-phosphate synthase/phosphatase